MRNLTIKDLIYLSVTKEYPIFRSNGNYNYNLNIWGFRSPSKDTVHFNDTCLVFYENTKGHWFIDKFVITTDPFL